MRLIANLVRRNKFLYNMIVRFRKRTSFLGAFYADYSLNVKHAVSGGQYMRSYRYHVLMLSHFLEKGMNYTKLRPFGHRHIRSILEAMPCFSKDEREGFEYHAGLSALSKWAEVFQQQGWTEEPLLTRVREFLAGQPSSAVPMGVKKHAASSDPEDEMLTKLEDDTCCILTRHSVRDFKDQPLTRKDLDFALRCFSSTPIACNRQMCKIYQVENPQSRTLLSKTIHGIGGLNTETMHYFLVVYDMAAIFGAKERNQGFLNAGLAAMNFVNGLHHSGLGSCILQWDVDQKKEGQVKNALGLPARERIAVVIAAGHKNSEYTVPCSARKPISDVFKVID